MTPVCPQGYHAPRAFIAAQSPMEASLSDFWSLIVENKVQTVLLLCQLVEDSKVRHMHDNKNAPLSSSSCIFVSACICVCVCVCANVITLPCPLSEDVMCNVSSFPVVFSPGYLLPVLATCRGWYTECGSDECDFVEEESKK